MAINRTAFIWGIAESTLLFFVPDVWLSYVAKDSLKKGLIAGLFATAGALIGGSLMYVLGAIFPQPMQILIAKIPAISQQMMNQVSNDLQNHGAISLLFGPLKGKPYKVFAILAEENNLNYVYFFLISIPARLCRFWLVTAIFHYGAHFIQQNKPQWQRGHIIVFCWACFYTLFLIFMPN